jgi:hypothetical protein
MATYLFITRQRESAEDVRETGEGCWSCSKTTREGDRVLVYFAGDEPGIAHEWRATSNAELDDEWKYACDVQHVRSFSPIIALSEMRRAVPKKESPILHHPQGRAIKIPEKAADRVIALRGRVPIEGAREEKPCTNTGAGFGDPDANPEVERAAVDKVRELFEEKGWQVHSRESECVGYDLKCVKGNQEKHIEVKGTRGDVERFIVTRKELDTLRRDPKFVLAVVLRAIGTDARVILRTGQEAEKDFRFDAIQYMATKPFPCSGTGGPEG